MFVKNDILVDTLADTIISGLKDEKHLCNTVLRRNDETCKQAMNWNKDTVILDIYTKFLMKRKLWSIYNATYVY